MPALRHTTPRLDDHRHLTQIDLASQNGTSARVSATAVSREPRAIAHALLPFEVRWLHLPVDPGFLQADSRFYPLLLQSISETTRITTA